MKPSRGAGGNLGFTELRGLAAGLVFLLAAAAGAADLPAGAGGKPSPGAVRLAIPIYGSIVQMSLPAGWKLAHEQASQAQYLSEYLPSGQRLENWQEMITVQGFRGLGERAGMSRKVFLRRIAEGFNQTCPGQVLGFSLGERQIDGRPASLALMGCASLGGKLAQPERSEFALYIAFTLGSDLVLIQKARRGPRLAPDRPPLQGAELEAFWTMLQPIRVCAGSTGSPRCP